MVNFGADKAEVSSLSREDLTNVTIINNLGNASKMFFYPLKQLLSVQPDIRAVNLSQKRRKSQSQSANSQSSTGSSQSSQRIVSAGSIADPTQDSAGGGRVYTSKEKTSDTFANQFLGYTITGIWPSGLTLEWAEGRDPKPSLEWSDT